MADGESILKRVIQPAAEALQRHIGEAGGREVFFAGTLDDAAMITEVRVLARGHAEAVPALFAQLNLREVVLHNHPTGNLEPSNADIELAAIYSNHGHGVYIIDNEATRVYVVVEPFVPAKKTLLNHREFASAFNPDSKLAAVIEGFELRPQQLKMTEAIVRAFNGNGVAVIEAPTGVGKTMAYLLPAIQWALRNKERIVISTRTINLQEQIIGHDLPLLEKFLETPFRACLVKGRGNYLCLRKLERAFAEISLFDDTQRADQLRGISDWTKKTRDGSSSDLPFMADRSLWEKVNCEADMCGGGNCRHFRDCFLTRARRDMAQADLLVVNHHLLFADIAIKKTLDDFTAAAVLPRYGRVILDEAHSIEDAATEYFGLTATRLAMYKVIGRLLRVESEQQRGLLPFLKLKLMRNCPTLTAVEYNEYVAFIESQLSPALLLSQDALDEAFTALREYVADTAKQTGKEIKWRLTPDILSQPELRRLHGEFVMPAVMNTRKAILLGEKLNDKLREITPGDIQEESPVQMEILELTACLRRMTLIADALAECTEDTLSDNTVRWIEIDGFNDNIVRVARCPLAVGKPLAEFMYEKMDTIVMTSATLAVRRRFEYFVSRVGIDLLDPDRVATLLLDSPFDYKNQALLCVPSDGPEPRDTDYLEETTARIRRILSITQGHAFVLFTSFFALDYVYSRLESELRDRHIMPLCQGKATRSRLLDQFRGDPASVLFGTDSFWEGVDVAGDALQCVIVARLPFRVPSEPILEARAEAIAQAGGNAFRQYSLPQAVIKLRQGLGRLIRRRSDWGSMIILDNRVVTKYYGTEFIGSLPAMPVVRGTAEVVFEALDAFYAGRTQADK